jgi:hypothetical protein
MLEPRAVFTNSYSNSAIEPLAAKERYETVRHPLPPAERQRVQCALYSYELDLRCPILRHSRCSLTRLLWYLGKGRYYGATHIGVPAEAKDLPATQSQPRFLMTLLALSTCQRAVARVFSTRVIGTPTVSIVQSTS